MLKSPDLPFSNRVNSTTLTVSPRRLFWFLLASLLVIVTLGGIANALIYQVLPDADTALGRALRRIDIGHEPSLIQWYSSLLHASCAMLLFVIAKCKRQRGLRDSGYWFVLGLGFLILSLDEAVMIHEMGDRLVNHFGQTKGIFYFAWVIPALVVVLGSVLLFWRFLMRLDSPTRTYFMFAGAIFVTGAIGVEMIEGEIAEHWLRELSSGRFEGTHPWGMPAMTLCQVVEEGMELLGISIFLVAALSHVCRFHRKLEIVPSYEVLAESQHTHQTVSVSRSS